MGHSARISEFQERLREISTQCVECGIANALLRLGDRAGQEAHGCAAIAFPVTRRDLAEMCCPAMRTVNRVLTTWQMRKLLTTAWQRIMIRKIAALREIVLHQPAK